MIRLLLVHAIRLVGELMVAALTEEPDIEVIGYAITENEALTKLRQESYDVILLDINLPDNAAYCLLSQLMQSQSSVKILMTGLINSETVILHCLEEGAAGYVLEEESWAEFVNKIRCVQRDEFIISPRFATRLIARIAELRQVAMELNGFKTYDLSHSTELTAREREVLKLIEQGLTNLEVANQLTIELGTVKNHVHNIFSKLGVGNRQYAALYARQMLNDEALRVGQP